MASSDIRFQDSDFVFKIIGARGKGLVVFADCLRVLRGREEFVGGRFLGVGFGKQGLRDTKILVNMQSIVIVQLVIIIAPRAARRRIA